MEKHYITDLEIEIHRDHLENTEFAIRTTFNTMDPEQVVDVFIGTVDKNLEKVRLATGFGEKVEIELHQFIMDSLVKALKG